MSGAHPFTGDPHDELHRQLRLSQCAKMCSFLQGRNTAKILSKGAVCPGTGGKMADASSRQYQCSLATDTICPQIRFPTDSLFFPPEKPRLKIQMGASSRPQFNHSLQADAKNASVAAPRSLANGNSLSLPPETRMLNLNKHNPGITYFKKIKQLLVFLPLFWVGCATV